jgi:Ohr subfamily peroxiredoxin
MEVLYTTTGSSTGDGRNGHAALADGSLEFEMATAGSDRQGNNPEQFFALGYAACFHSALKLVGGRMGKSVDGSIVNATVTIGRDENGFGLAVELSASIPGLSAAEVRELLEAAHEVCPYSKATRGNIPVTLAVA